MDETAVFATTSVGRIFLGCDRCRRVMPHYKAYGRYIKKKTDGMCRCGSTVFRPTHIPEWRAAWWVLVVGWLWRKTIRKEKEWDPRMPIRMEHVHAEIPA